MRYTETRLSPISHESLLGDISEALVDFIDNFGQLPSKSPIVLPGPVAQPAAERVYSGIAVGDGHQHSSPTNMAEVIDGLIALIDRPNLSEDDLFRLIPRSRLPPLGGEDLWELRAFTTPTATGRAVFPFGVMVTQFEEIRPGRGRPAAQRPIIITELPYQVNKAGWIEKSSSAGECRSARRHCRHSRRKRPGRHAGGD